MRVRLAWVVAAVIGLMSLYPLAVAAQQPAPAPTNVAPLTARELDQLVAPIALYPDPLIAQILMAATYPLEVVEADRWLRASGNGALQGDELTAAVEQQPWDPSIKSLVPFPAVLRMMDDNLGWTERLGDAFLAQQADVMDAVQRLRRRAERAGSLVSTPQQKLVDEEQEIVIEPTNAAVLYVPTYNPWCAFGPWPYADYPPFYFATSPGYCVPILTFGAGIYPPFGFWAWASFEWRRHHIRIDHDRFRHFHARYVPPGGIWRHNPAHRHGVAYRNPQTAARFLGPRAAPRREFRGFSPAAATAPRAVPAAPRVEHAPAVLRGSVRGHAVRRPPPAFESFGRGGQVRNEAARGFSSRVSPAPTARMAPASSFRAAPRGGGIGGRR